MQEINRHPVFGKCHQCGAVFRSYLSRQKTGKGKFCSRLCAHKHRTKRVKCLFCGFEWDHPKSQKGDKYCSMKCRVLATNKKVICGTCGKLFLTWISRGNSGRGKYCSSACYWKSLGIEPELLSQHKREACRKYRREHPEWCAEVKHRRRARESRGHFSANDWRSIKERQDYKCAICGKREPEIKLTVDHIVSLARGGGNEASNIQGLCGSCNSRKSYL